MVQLLDHGIGTYYTALIQTRCAIWNEPQTQPNAAFSVNQFHS